MKWVKVRPVTKVRFKYAWSGRGRYYHVPRFVNLKWYSRRWDQPRLSVIFWCGNMVTQLEVGNTPPVQLLPCRLCFLKSGKPAPGA